MTFLVIYSKMSVYPDKICHLQLNSRQIMLYIYCLKSYHSRTYFQYMIRYNNVSLPVNDPHDPPCAPPPTRLPSPKSWGFVTPQTPRIDADAHDLSSAALCG